MEAVVIGLTGGIACGKSTIAEFLAAKGAIIINADQEAKELMKSGSPTCERLVAEFGGGILQPDCSIDSRALADMVFANKEKLARLNAIVHPDTIEHISEIIRRYRNLGQWPAIILDAPLLFEAGAEQLVDYTWAVIVEPQVQIDRLLARDGISLTQAQQRLAAQLPQGAKAARADAVIDNSGSRKNTNQQVAKLWQKFVVDRK